MARDWNGSSAGGKVNGGRLGRRSFLKATGAGAAGVALAGCTSGGEDAGTTTGTTQEPFPDTVTVGVLAPAPSENPTGNSIANGARYAAQKLNEEGGVGGASVEVTVKDTEASAEAGREAYQELLDEGVDVTTGVFTSEVLLNLMDDIAAAETVHMTTGAATPEASGMVNDEYEKYKYHFRTGPINGYHFGLSMVDFAGAKLADLGWESVAVLVEDYEWTKPVSEVLNDHLDGAGLDIAMQTRYEAGTEDFGSLFDRVEESDADAAYVAMAHTGTDAVVQWAKQQRPFEFGGIHVPMQLPSYFEAVGGACRYAVTLNMATPTSNITDNTIPFAEAYNYEFDGYPVYTGYITYDAVMQFGSVLGDIESVASDDVVKGLERSSHVGTTGTIEYFPPHHDFAHDVLYDLGRVFPLYHQWQVNGNGNGVQEVIWPDDLSEGSYVKPPWV